MSRIGKNPIPIPDKVSVEIKGLAVKVKGPKGELSRVLPEGVEVSQADNNVTVSPSNSSRRSRERHGLCRRIVHVLHLGLALHMGNGLLNMLSNLRRSHR